MMVVFLFAMFLLACSADVRPTRRSVDHNGVPSLDAPLTPEEIKDAFHEPAVVMAEVQRLQTLGISEAVSAIVDGTSVLAVGHTIHSDAIEEKARKFAAAMRGITFLEISDSLRPENLRYRKALFVAACASLSAEARARADDATEDEAAQ